ncbi:MAG TPA: major capsid protein, partial [Acidimicrobiales bacterium]
FNQIVNSSITANVSLATTTLSATRDLLNHLDLAAWNMRTRHRTLRDYPFRVILPDIALGVMRTDIARSMPGGSFVENMAVAEQVIQRFFAERSLNVTWSPDLVVQNAPADSQPLADWPSQIPYAIYPEGTFLHLDAGELDLGVVRDSELNSTNDFEVFAETFEAVHPFGVEAIAGNVEVCPSGAVSGTEDLSSICGTGS